MEQAIEAEKDNREKQRDDMKFVAATPDNPEWQWPTYSLNGRQIAGQPGSSRARRS
jgi:hypothetical protein